MANPNFLILDEPTNDLDIYTLQILEEFLLDFPGCLIVVSHDRYFMDRLVEHIWVLRASREVRFSQGITASTDWPRPTRNRKLRRRGKRTKPPPNQMRLLPAKNDYSKRLSFKEKFEFEQLEGKMAELEQQKASLTELYANPDRLNFSPWRKIARSHGTGAAENRWQTVRARRVALLLVKIYFKRPGALELGLASQDEAGLDLIRLERVIDIHLGFTADHFGAARTADAAHATVWRIHARVKRSVQNTLALSHIDHGRHSVHDNGESLRGGIGFCGRLRLLLLRAR